MGTVNITSETAPLITFENDEQGGLVVSAKGAEHVTYNFTLVEAPQLEKRLEADSSRPPAFVFAHFLEDCLTITIIFIFLDFWTTWLCGGGKARFEVRGACKSVMPVCASAPQHLKHNALNAVILFTE